MELVDIYGPHLVRMVAQAQVLGLYMWLPLWLLRTLPFFCVEDVQQMKSMEMASEKYGMTEYRMIRCMYDVK